MFCLDVVGILRFVIGFALPTLVPGFAMSYAFFPKKDDLDGVERLVTSLLLSISVIPLVMYYSNKLLKIPITVWSNLVYITIVTAISAGVWYRRIKR